jgi:pyruvate dehydrogenase E1 component alpha subunit
MNIQLALELLRQMLRIRAVEEAIAERYPEGRMRCPTHLSIGQEAVPAAVSACLKPTDFAVSTHRAHAHYLAKGGNLAAMIAEIYGKATGCSKGKGGSMHLIDLTAGFMGSTAIVGNSIPVGVGLALSAQLKNTDQISCIFVGDGAVEQGVFYESVNFAVLKKLPVLFVCENNLYSVYSPLSVRQPAGRQIAAMVSGIGAHTMSGNGNCVMECYEIINMAVKKIRENNGPWFVEFYTYRLREHCGHDFDDHLGYRPQEQINEWKRRDPIFVFETELTTKYPALIENIATSKKSIEQEIQNAFSFAENSPFPEPEQAYTGVYTQEKI